MSTATVELTNRLRHLVARSDAWGASYRSCMEGFPPLVAVVGRVECEAVKGGGALGVVVYVVQLLRRVILNQFRLLCQCKEVAESVEVAYEECREICEAVETFNQRIVPQLKRCQRNHRRPHASDCLRLSDFTDVFLSTHCTIVTQRLMESLTAETALHTAGFELGFTRALLGLWATFTSLLPNQPAGQRVFVAAEAFSLAEGSMTWWDCLVPGAQSESLRGVWQGAESQLWGRVGDSLLMTWGLLPAKKSITTLRGMAQCEVLERYSTVRKCFSHSAAILDQWRTISHWDTGFQRMLAASREESQRGYRNHSTTRLLVTQVLPPLQYHRPSTTNPHGPQDLPGLAEHVDSLILSQPLCRALGASTKSTAVFLAEGLNTALAGWNLKVLARLLFEDAPVIIEALMSVTSQCGVTRHAAFPPGSPLQLWECCGCRSYSTVYAEGNQLKEMVEGVCESFIAEWRMRCASLLIASFPPPKVWRTLGKKCLGEVVPSDYCELIIEHLLLPLVGVASSLPIAPQERLVGMASSLPIGPQERLVGMAVGILMSEFRRAVTANQRTYRPAAGRQLLADYRHLAHWMASGDLALHLHSSLPVMAEIEHGLLTMCGTADHTPHPITWSLSTPSPLHHTLLTERAWYSPQDWTQCIA